MECHKKNSACSGNMSLFTICVCYKAYLLNQRKNSKLEYYYLYKYRLHCTHQISLWTYQSLLYVCCYLFVIETYITYIVLYYLPTYILTYLLLNTFFHVCPFLIFKLSPPAQLLLKNLETKVFRSFLST